MVNLTDSTLFGSETFSFILLFNVTMILNKCLCDHNTEGKFAEGIFFFAFLKNQQQQPFKSE